MKKFLIVMCALLFSVASFAQKAERENIRKGNKEYRQQKYSTAEQRYKSAIKVNPGSKEAIYNLANTSYKQGRWDEALKGYEKYVSLEKQNPLNLGMAFHNMGNVYLHKHPAKDDKENYLEKAIDSYKQSLRINPNDDETRYNLAVAQKLRQDQGKGGNNDKNKDKNKDKDKDKNKQDQNKDQNKDQDKKDQQNKDNKQDKQEQMSQSNAEQLLKAIQQDEKQTQDRIKQMKAAERKQKNDDNRRNNKDW
jgi:Ca-activated chloride channel homolog